jgi:hypothetical protein
VSPWRAYLLMCMIIPDGKVPYWTGTHGEMISSDLHGAEEPNRWTLRPQQGAEIELGVFGCVSVVYLRSLWLLCVHVAYL